MTPPTPSARSVAGIGSGAAPPGGGRLHRLRRSLSPARLLLLSFLALVAFGTAGLLLVPGLYAGPRLSFLDAVFTATSAVCVTGLIVVDTATYFTGAGQAFILLLIQLGGLGILTFTTLIIVALGRRLSLSHEAVTAQHTQVAPQVDFRKLVRSIVLLTLFFEAVGAVILFGAFLPRFSIGQAAWHAVFQSVSAFCNAGFSTFSDSLMSFQSAPVVLSVIMVLIVLGGVGFLTLEELQLRRRSPRTRSVRLSLHSRLVLAVTAILLATGWVAFTAMEWGNTLADMPAWARMLNGLFMSVTARTAGFNTVDHAATTDGTNFLTIVFMSIGGSPGSTAGGLKTTTVAVMGLLAYARLRGRRVTSVWGRTVPEETVQRAVGLFVVAFGTVTGAILLYVAMHAGPPGGLGGQRFLAWMFEATSAFNTVGLSMGATGELAGPGKILTIALMYLGRIGPLTFAAAIALDSPPHKGEFRYAHEDVIIG